MSIKYNCKQDFTGRHRPALASSTSPRANLWCDYIFFSQESTWHTSYSHWFHVDVIYSFPKLFHCEMDLLALIPTRINLMIFQRDLVPQVWLCCLAFFAWARLLGEPIYQLYAGRFWRQTSLVLQGLLRHDWLTTYPFFPSYLHGAKHGVMRRDLAAEQYVHKKIKPCRLKEWPIVPPPFLLYCNLPILGRIYLKCVTFTSYLFSCRVVLRVTEQKGSYLCSCWIAVELLCVPPLPTYAFLHICIFNVNEPMFKKIIHRREEIPCRKKEPFWTVVIYLYSVIWFSLICNKKKKKKNLNGWCS